VRVGLGVLVGVGVGPAPKEAHEVKKKAKARKLTSFFIRFTSFALFTGGLQKALRNPSANAVGATKAECIIKASCASGKNYVPGNRKRAEKNRGLR
jgi:hypothetical protein